MGRKFTYFNERLESGAFKKKISYFRENAESMTMVASGLSVGC
tara:strand:- start:138 stop:266 length:129 start_codon:yes stop_codon:yes gene_type:complete